MNLTKDTYGGLVAQYRGGNVVRDISIDLVPLWCDAYNYMNPQAELVQVDVDTHGTSCSYLFDIALERNIVAFGMPILSKHQRDKNRQNKHPRSGGSKFDRGHLIAHALGGGMDINVAPQLSKLNQGDFKVLETKVRKLTEQNVRCFYFVRSIYTNKSTMPRVFEQCVIHPLGTIDYEIHRNF